MRRMRVGGGGGGGGGGERGTLKGERRDREIYLKIQQIVSQNKYNKNKLTQSLSFLITNDILILMSIAMNAFPGISLGKKKEL